MKEQLKELVGLLRQSEIRRKEVEKELKLREQAVAIALATSASVRLISMWNFKQSSNMWKYKYLPTNLFLL